MALITRTDKLRRLIWNVSLSIHNILRGFIRKINSPDRFVSVISLILSLLVIIGFTIWINEEYQKEGFTLYTLLSDYVSLTIGLGALIAGIIFMRNVVRDIQDIFFQEEQIITGIGLSDSRYSYKYLLDDKCKEVIIVGQNMRTLMSDSVFRNHIIALLKNDKDVKVTFILSTPEILKAMSKTLPQAYRHFIDSVTEMRDMYHENLGESERNRFSVHSHVGASSLSATIRDPSDNARGIITFTVKWSTDRDSQNRVFCVVEKRENRVLFNRLFGHVADMTRSESGSLKEICEKIEVKWLD